jgi:pimeloyl-ACP methyl ester carboxylesterase
MLLPDGRRLAYQAMGAQGSPAALVLHGTPGSSRQLAGLDRHARDRGLAFIAPDRDGFLDDLRHPSPTTARATARDFWLFARGWDVDIADIADIAVPAHVGGGHMLLSHLDKIIESLAPQQG